MSTGERIGVLGNIGNAIVGGMSAIRRPKPEATEFAKIDKEIKAGLTNERDRLRRSWECRQWLESDTEAFLKAMARELDLRDETVRQHNFLRRITRIRTKHLYSSAPKRTIQDNEAATDYLNFVYTKSGFDSIMKQANRYAFATGVCAIQAELNEPNDETEEEATLARLRPAVSFRIWPADQYVVWVSPNKPTIPWAVGVIDAFDEQRRIRVWTESKIRTYVTSKFDRANPWAGTAYNPMGETDNFLGFIPFFFVPWEPQIGTFWSPYPGMELIIATEHATSRLWKSGDDIIFQRPLLAGAGIRSDFALPRNYRAGELVRIEPVMDRLGNGTDPALYYLTPDLGYLANDRDDLERYLLSESENHEVPESAYRLTTASATSGAQVVAEQLPVIDAAEDRQKELEPIETNAALVTLLAAGVWIGKADQKSAEDLLKAATSLELSIQWGPMTKTRPGQEFDQHQAFKDSYGITSEISMIAEIEDVTPEQAAERYEQIVSEKAEAKRIREQYGIEEPAADPNADPNADPGTDPNADPESDDSTEEVP